MDLSVQQLNEKDNIQDKKRATQANCQLQNNFSDSCLSYKNFQSFQNFLRTDCIPCCSTFKFSFDAYILRNQFFLFFQFFIFSGPNKDTADDNMMLLILSIKLFIIIAYHLQEIMNVPSRSKSKSLQRKKKKDKKAKKDKQRASGSRSQSAFDKYPYEQHHSEKKKKKEKHKSKKNKSKSRERSREKKKKRQRSRASSDEKDQPRPQESRIPDKKEESPRRPAVAQLGVQRERKQDRQRQNNRLQERNRPRERQPSPPFERNKKNTAEEDRAKKFAMRQVRARLLKLNGLLGVNSDDSDDVPPPAPEPAKPAPVEAKPATTVSAVASRKTGRKESKWGKTNSNQSSILPIQSHPEPTVDKPKEVEKQLSLDIQPSEDRLRLSEDKSMDIEDHQSIGDPLHVIDEEEIDPLDEYMNEIEAEAAPQMDLPKKGQNRNIITFEDIVTQPQNTAMDQQRGEQEQFKKQFLEAINNMEEVKAQQQEKKGTMMENHDDKQSDISDFQEQPEEELDFFAKQRKMAERKELHSIDHSKIEYEEVNFNLYREAEQIHNLDPKQVAKYRKEAGDIKIRGKNLLNPVFNWYHCGFNEAILNTIQKNNFAKPFPIQAQSIPMILSGRDVIGIAETGSGKTFAYLLPLLKHVSSQRPVEDGEGPIGLIMTPTRQLANQVYLEAKKFCKNTRIRVLAVYGGLQVQKQLSDLRKGAEIIICTPGRMIDILTLNKGKLTNLRRVTMVVIDEADRMFDLGFEPQITKIIDNIRPHRQTIMFSATFPKNVQNLARKILTNPAEILVGSRGQACRNVEQIIEVREQMTKFLRLLEILGHWNDKGSILIFIDKQNEADFLYSELLKYGYDCLVLHGAMDPTDREFTIYDFKKRIKTIMIATSVCARGLDIKEIVLVINFKCPNHLEDYIHRIGRTGRAGNKGTAITFITPQEEHYSLDLIKALEISEIQPPEDLINLSEQFMQKVKKGEARKMRNKNIQGAGFKFDKQEEEKNSQIKDMIKKQLKNEGLGGFEDSDDDDIETKKKKEETLRGRNDQERVVEAIKNPEIKNKLLNEAVKAVSEAIKGGSAMTTQKLLQVAVNSMKQSVTKHKVITTVDDGIEQVTKIINSFQNKGDGQGIDFFSYDFEINDYPPAARQRACTRDFLSQVQRENNCTISLRGVYVEPGKKAPVGCRKLYLHIQAEDKSYVSTAYKDIKRVIEEGAYENMHMSTIGKFNI